MNINATFICILIIFSNSCKKPNGYLCHKETKVLGDTTNADSIIKSTLAQADVKQKDTSLNKIEVFKTVRILPKPDGLIDSVVIYGSADNESNFKYVDSIFVYYFPKVKGKVYPWGEKNQENDVPKMYFQENQNCFGHFNDDTQIDLFFANDSGGSGGTYYNIFNYNAKLKTHKMEKLLFHKPNICFVRKSKHYLSIGKGGDSFIAGERFAFSGDSIKRLSLFTSHYKAGGTTKYDTIRVVYSYFSNDNDWLGKKEECYTWTDLKTDQEKSTCSTFMQRLENQLWKDWEVYCTISND